MSPEQVEDAVLRRIHQQPFMPFVVDLADGETLTIPHPRLAVNGSGAVFFSLDGILVDFEFKDVRAIRTYSV